MKYTCLLFVAVTLFASAVHATTTQPLNWTLVKVAGQRGKSGGIDGFSNESTLTNVVTMCSYESDSKYFAIGDSKLIRIYDRDTTFLETAYPRDTLWTQPIISCAAGLSHIPQGPKYVVYLSALPASGMIYALTKDSLTVKHVSTTLQLFDIAYFEDNVYILGSHNTLLTCRAATPEWTSKDCTSVVLDIGDIPTINIIFTVQKTGIYLATGFSIIHFDFDGNKKYSLSLAATDLHSAASNGQMHALSGNTIFRITDTGTELTSSVVFNSTSSRVLPPSNVSQNSIFKILPMSVNDFYIVPQASPPLYIIERLYLDNVSFAKTLSEPPLPVGFIDQANIMPQLLLSINDNIQQALNETHNITWVKSNSIQVNQTSWDTNMVIEVPQRTYNPPETNNTISALTFSSTETLLAQYYEKDNIFIYSDRNIHPLCNPSMMSLMKYNVASWARTQLDYPLIYATPIVSKTIDGNPNITASQLLMPLPLRNATSRGLLSQDSYLRSVLRFLENNLPEEKKYVTNFDSSYKFDLLDSALQQTARWIILDLIRKQISLCEASPQDSNMRGKTKEGGLVSVEAEATCTNMDILITNLTRGEPRAKLQGFFYIQAFGLGGYKIPFDKCLENLDYAPLQEWINEVLTPKKATSRCDTKCVTAISVVAAVITASAVIFVILIVSKRRRLAVALAPETRTDTTFADHKQLDKTSSDRYKVGSAVNPYNPV